MNATEKYNGWQNYETWAVNLWMDNDRGSNEHYSELARECWGQSESELADHPHWSRSECARFALADRLKEDHETGKDDLLESAKASCTVWADLLGAALAEVNWDEIADSWLCALELDGYESAKG